MRIRHRCAAAIIACLMRDADLGLRQFRSADAGLVAGVLAEPQVRRWWPGGGYEPENGWVIEVGGELAGWVQYLEESDAWYPSVALDIALAAALHGRGYGRRALRLVVGFFLEKGHHRFTIDPAVENERAIRCYTAVGFRPVGVLRAYQRNPGGGFTDGLLMDMVLLDGAPSRAPS